MNDQYAAWVMIAVASFGLAALALVALQRWPRARWLGAGLVLAWTATPFPSDEGHLAPALVVFFFRRFLEEAANPRPPLALLLLATVAVLVVYGVAYFVVWRLDARRGWRKG